MTDIVPTPPGPGTPGKVSITTAYPEPPSKKHNDLAIELISGSVGGALQVLVGQVRCVLRLLIVW